MWLVQDENVIFIVVGALIWKWYLKRRSQCQVFVVLCYRFQLFNRGKYTLHSSHAKCNPGGVAGNDWNSKIYFKMKKVFIYSSVDITFDSSWCDEIPFITFRWSFDEICIKQRRFIFHYSYHQVAVISLNIVMFDWCW